MTFPKGFLWGVSTSSYQIEGGAFDDGKGPSIWDVFCRKPGAIAFGHTGDVACDFYHRHAEDIALMKQLGVRAHRFSVSWPRVMPEATGRVNEKGLAFYERIVDEMLAAGIRPLLALYHWDLPQEAHCRGGWLNRDIASWFAEYARVMVDRLSDRVTDWITFVEPVAFIGAGYAHDRHAPGLKLSRPEWLRAMHHVLLAHGRAAQVVRAHARRPPRVSLSHVGSCFIPGSADPRDIEAARMATFEAPAQADRWTNGWLLDPIYHGGYPERDLEFYGADAPPIAAGDMETIHQRPDFFALNYYFARYARMGPDGVPQFDPGPIPAGKRSAMGWTMLEEGLYWKARFAWERYQVPLFITENGMANLDWVALDGQVHDPQRIDFLRRHIGALGRACQDGVAVEGYLTWSFLDNFEWAEGYEKRFGLVYVDFDSQRRILKDSALWYQTVIARNGLVPPSEIGGH